jgi:hypothetical protein
LGKFWWGGLKPVGQNLNHESLIDEMERIRELDFGALMAMLSRDPDRKQGTMTYLIFKADLKNNCRIPVTDWQ